MSTFFATVKDWLETALFLITVCAIVALLVSTIEFIIKVVGKIYCWICTRIIYCVMVAVALVVYGIYCVICFLIGHPIKSYNEFIRS